MHILGIGAHPDDLEVLCAGTLAKYVKHGHKVTMCHVNNGDKGHFQWSKEKTASVREKEALSSAKIIDAEVINLNISDGELFSNRESRLRIIEVVRHADPDVIITHAPNDYMSDHTATSEIVCQGSFYANVAKFDVESLKTDKCAPVFFMDTVAGIDFIPTEYVDITDTFPTKLEMLKKHKSQTAYMEEFGNINLLEIVETVARYRGLQCGVQYAEAFRQYMVWPRMKAERLLP